MYAKDNLIIAIMTNGEGYHNFHHTFPWDYKACELGKFSTTTFIINCFAKLGLAYDLKVTPPEYLERIICQYGDQTHRYSKRMPHEIPYERVMASVKPTLFK